VMAGHRLELCNRSGGSGLLEHRRRVLLLDIPSSKVFKNCPQHYSHRYQMTEP